MLLVYDIFIKRDDIQKFITLVIMTDFAYIMGKSICHNYIWDFQFHIVADNLVKNLIIYCNIRRFTFHQHYRLASSVMNQNIYSPCKLIHMKIDLNSYQSGRIFSLLNEVLNEILPNPFFRCQSHILFPQGIKYHF